MIKKLLLILGVIMMFFTACGEKTLQKDEITIYHATDMHYLSQQLTDNSEYFVEYIRAGDGKMVHYIEVITEAFVSEVTENKPDYLLIGGDITFNGEKLSHQDFAEKLKRIEQAGTQVLVIPGNHDVEYPFSFGFTGNSMYATDRIQKADFEAIYTDFGLNQAYSRDEKSFSYFYRLTDKITVLALDTNTAGGTGFLDVSTLEWVERELKKVKDGVKVIAFTHQTVIDHYPEDALGGSYYIINNIPLIELFKKYNVQLNLAGHIHTQHKAVQSNLTEMATESMAVLPCSYGVINCTLDGIDYSKQAIDIEKWAEKSGQTDENLLNFKEYAREFYMSSQINLCKSALQEYGLTVEEVDIMSEFFAEMNIYYFSGTIDQHYIDLSLSDGYNMWKEKGNSLWHYQYINGRMEEGRAMLDHDRAQIIFE